MCFQFLIPLVLSRLMEAILKAKSCWQTNSGDSTAVNSPLKLAGRISFGCSRRAGFVSAARGGLLPAARRGGLVPAARGGLVTAARGRLVLARGGLVPTARGGLVLTAGGRFVPAARPTGISGAERAAEKCGPVAAAAAVAPGHSEAAAELCVDKHCLLNMCKVTHDVKSVTKALHRDTVTSSGLKASQLWRSSVMAMKKNVQMSVAESTAKTYGYWWTRFCTFCDRTGAVQMPFSSHTAAVFLSSLAESAAGLGGVDAARSALRHHFVVMCPDVKCPTEGSEVTLVMKGIKRRFEQPVSKKSPLSGKDFYKILNKLLNKDCSKTVKLCQLRLAAQVSLMFMTFSRYEESSALMRSQVKRCQGELKVIFRKGKTYQHGEARNSVIASQPGPLNPVTVILMYMDRLAMVDKAVDGFLFPALRSTTSGDSVLARPASYRSVLRQFKEVVVAAGVTADPAAFGLHSMRRGAVTAAINNGASDHIVQKQMRVSSSSTVRRYATLSDVMLKTASAAIFKKV